VRVKPRDLVLGPEVVQYATRHESVAAKTKSNFDAEPAKMEPHVDLSVRDLASVPRR
jgi:hypothetical protein